MNEKNIAIVSSGSSVRLVTEEEFLDDIKMSKEFEVSKHAKDIMIAAALMTAAIGGPYMDMPYPYIPKHNHSRHTAGSIYCHECGDGGSTLYKDKEGYICRACRKKTAR